jgi:hypothetical protein
VVFKFPFFILTWKGIAITIKPDDKLASFDSDSLNRILALS